MVVYRIARVNSIYTDFQTYKKKMLEWKWKPTRWRGPPLLSINVAIRKTTLFASWWFVRCDGGSKTSREPANIRGPITGKCVKDFNSKSLRIVERYGFNAEPTQVRDIRRTSTGFISTDKHFTVVKNDLTTYNISTWWQELDDYYIVEILLQHIWICGFACYIRDCIKCVCFDLRISHPCKYW